MFIGLLSFAGLFVFLILALISKLKETGKAKRMMFYAAGCFLLLIAAVSFDSSGDTQTASTKVEDESKESQKQDEKKKEEAKKQEAKEKAEAEAKKKAQEEANKKKAEEEAKKKAEAAAKKKVEQETPQSKLIKAVTKAIGKESNREGEKLSKLSIDPAGNIVVKFKGDDNLTENFIVSGIKMDIADVLKAVKQSGVAFKNLNVIVTFSMVDQYGNAKESDVVDLTYSKATIDKINFENFSYKNVYAIADVVGFVHPQFVGKN